jgi:hypothetical protein
MNSLDDIKYTGRHVDHEGKRYFPIVDIIASLVGSKDPAKYWHDMKRREKIELSAICRKLKIRATDNKLYKMDCVDIEGLFRLVQSIPSPKVELFKQLMARLAVERIEEYNDPELGIRRASERAVRAYKSKGMSDVWIENRMEGIQKRNSLTDILKESGVKTPTEFASITAKAHASTFGLTPRGHKDLKNLPVKAKLRDNMVDVELAITKLSESMLESMIKEDGLSIDTATERHASMMKQTRLALEAGRGRPLATKETPRKLLK